MKIAISYRVLQAWRVPVFEKLSQCEGVELMVFYGEDFINTKIKSYAQEVSFVSKKLKTYKFKTKTKNGYAYIPFCPSLFAELKKFEPDVVITEGASNIFNNVICFIYTKLFSKKLIQWGLGEIRGRSVSYYRKILNIPFNWIERLSDAAIVYSKFGSRYYSRIGIPDDRIFVAVNVVDTEKRFKEYLEYVNDNNLTWPRPVPVDFHVLFVGALEEGKEVEKLISAFKEVTRVNSDAHLTIIGDGTKLDSLIQYSEILGIINNITFTGHVTTGICKYFYNASIFVLPGLGGLAVSDALIHSVPVLCTIGDGCELDLVDGTNGTVIDNLTVKSLSVHLIELMNNKKKLTKWTTEASTKLIKQYSIGNYVNKIFEAVQTVYNDENQKTS